MTAEKSALRTWLELLTISNTLKKEIDNCLRSEFGMSISRFDVLAALDRAGAEGLRAGALSAALKVTDGNTTQITAPLIKQGYVQRSKNLHDGRVTIFQITPKGAKLFNKMAGRNKECVSRAFHGLSEAQMRDLRALLSKLTSLTIDGPDQKDAA